MKEEKVKNVLKQPTLKGVKDIQKFLRLANYYWQFIKNFAAISRLLYNIVKKNQKQKKTEVGEDILGIKGEVYKRTGISSTGIRLKK